MAAYRSLKLEKRGLRSLVPDNPQKFRAAFRK